MHFTRMERVLALGMGNTQKPGYSHKRCELANQRQQAWRRKMAGGLSSSVFGQMRCRKSPARGFWMFWIHWHCFQRNLKTSFVGFSPLKFQRAPGSLKPSLIKVMLRRVQVYFLWLDSHFWLIVMLWTLWDRFHIHLRTFIGVFSTRKLREV